MKVNVFMAFLSLIVGGLAFLLFNSSDSLIFILISTVLVFATVLVAFAVSVTENTRASINLKITSILFLVIFIVVHFVSRLFSDEESYYIINGLLLIVWLGISYGLIKSKV